MKVRHLILHFTICLANACLAAPEFVGVLGTRDATYVAVRLNTSGGTNWVRIGDRIGDYHATAYDPRTETLSLRRGDEELSLRLPSAKVQPMPPLTLLASLIKPGDAKLDDALQQAHLLEERRKKTDAELVELESRRPGDPEVTQLRRKLRIQESHLEYYIQALTAAARAKQ